MDDRSGNLSREGLYEGTLKLWVRGFNLTVYGKKYILP